jgi:hypothetical protein
VRVRVGCLDRVHVVKSVCSGLQFKGNFENGSMISGTLYYGGECTRESVLPRSRSRASLKLLYWSVVCAKPHSVLRSCLSALSCSQAFARVFWPDARQSAAHRRRRERRTGVPQFGHSCYSFPVSPLCCWLLARRRTVRRTQPSTNCIGAPFGEHKLPLAAWPCCLP